MNGILYRVKHLFLGLFVGCLLIGNFPSPVMAAIVPVARSAPSILPYFNAVDVGNGINLYLVPQKDTRRTMTIVAPRNTPPHVVLVCFVKDDVLYLRIQTTTSEPYCQITHWRHGAGTVYGPITLYITSNRLAGLTIRGNSQLNAGIIQGYGGFNVYAQGNSQVRLNGVFNLQSVTADDNAEVGIRWVKGPHLIARTTGRGLIRLAGAVHVLDVRSSGASWFDGKFLRAQQALVQTIDQAFAEITAVDSLNAFATDQSNITYFKTPGYITRLTRHSGNIVQVDYWQ